jgi:adenine-specific DNA-methyltransferase
VRTRNTSLKRRIIATIDESQKYNLNRLSNIIAKSGADIATLVAILCSEFMNYIFLTRFFNYEIKPVYLKQLPVATSKDLALTPLVGKRRELEEKLIHTRLAYQRTAIDTQISDVERKIDDRVYQLYQVSPAEINAIRERIGELPGKW